MNLSICLESTPTPLQSQVDSWVGGLLHQATDWRSVAAMTAGGLANRAGSLGILSAGGASLRPVLPSLSAAVGLAAEVSIFEMTQRGLASAPVRAQGPALLHDNSNLWRWSGQGGIRQGLLQSFVTFGILRGAGRLAQGQNWAFRHLLQDSGMVLGHQALGALSLTPRPTGSLAEQFLHAEAANLQLGAAMALGYRLAPGIHTWQRGLDLVLEATPAVLRPPARSFSGPFAYATVSGSTPASVSPRSSHSRLTPTILLSTSLNGETAENLAGGVGSFWGRGRELSSRLEGYDRAEERMRRGEELSDGEKALLRDPQTLELRRERDIRALAQQDLVHFAEPLSHAEKIPGLHRDLEKLYQEGVEAQSTRGEEPFSLNNYSTKPLALQDYRAFQAWQRFSSLPILSEPRDASNAGMIGLRSYLNQRTMELEGEASPYEAYYLLSLLEMLPSSFYRPAYLTALTLGSNRDLGDSRYDSGRVELHLGEVTKSWVPRAPVNRRQLMGVVFHELGHSVAARYAVSREYNRTDDSPKRLPPDPSIPSDVRRRMQQAFDTIRGTRPAESRSVFSVGFLETAERRRRFISSREKPYAIREFISDFALYYVAAPDALWNHFYNIRNPRVREAYYWIYQDMRDRIFEGHEYSGGYRTEKAPVPR